MRNNSVIFKEDLQNEQLCPITQEPFIDPVVTMDGHTYERKAIQEWFKKYQTSPKTNLLLPSKEIVPNHAFKNIITNFIPRFLTLYEGKKNQMQRQIEQQNLNHQEQKRKFQVQNQLLKTKNQNQLKQLTIQYKWLLVQKEKQLKQIKLSSQNQNKQNKQKLDQLKAKYQIQKEKQLKQIKLSSQNQNKYNKQKLDQLKAKYQKQTKQIKQIKQKTKIQYLKKQMQIQQLKYNFQYSTKKKQKQLSQLKGIYQQEIRQLKQKNKIHQGQLAEKQKQIQQLKLKFQKFNKKKQKQINQPKKILQKQNHQIQQQSKQKNKIQNERRLLVQQSKSKQILLQQKPLNYQKQKKQAQNKIPEIGLKYEKQIKKFEQINMNQINQQMLFDKKIDYEGSIHNLLKQSSILDREGLNLIIQWLMKPVAKIQFKFKASSNDFKIKKYYNICGNLNNTIIMAKTTKGKIIGGYTPLRFNRPAKWTHQFDDEYIKDESNSSFVFSLSEKKKFQINEQKKAICRYKDKCRIEFLWTFQIANESNTWPSNNAFYLGKNHYNTSKYPKSKQSYLKITGQQDYKFLTQQWQVYQVFFA